MPAAKSKPVYIGIKGSVLALDRATGAIIWEAELIGSDFVNVVLDGDDLLATTRGEIFCLDATTGHLRWQNPLRGYGYGVITIATVTPQIAPAAEKMRRDAEAAAHTATTTPPNSSM